MVAQQLTPELTQPNVLVEIDPGPTMGPYQETQRCVPERCLSESMSITSDASVSTSTYGPAVVSTAVEADGCPEASLGYDATACTKMQSHCAKAEVLDGGSFGNSGYLVTWQQPLGARCTKSGLTTMDTGEEAAFIGMNLKRSIQKDNNQGATPFSMAEKPTSHLSLPEGEAHRPLNSFELAHAVVPSLPDKEKDWAKTIGARGCPQRGLAQDWLSASRDPMSLPSLTGQVAAVSRDCALENRHRSFNRDSNVDNEVVIYEMAGDDKSAVIGTSNASQIGTLTRNFPTGQIEATRTTGQESSNGVELLFSMSCPNGTKADVNVDPGCIASEILMWMIQYNMMTSQCDTQLLPRLSVQSTELLLNLVAIAVSCLHSLLPLTVGRTARVRQCTAKVHCLLDDPG